MTPWTVACQAPLFMEFPRQEYWSGLLCPALGDLLDPWIKPVSPESLALAGGFITTVPPGKPLNEVTEGLNEAMLYCTLHSAWLTKRTCGTWVFLLRLPTGHF